MKRLAFALPLLLAACGGDAGGEGERKTAAGEVLGGTISDDMLPLDTVTSQSPPLREKATGGGGSADAVDGATAPPQDTEGGPGEPPRDPAPAATPEAPASEEPAE